MSKKNFGLAAQLVRPRIAQEIKLNTPLKPTSSKLPKLPEAPIYDKEPAEIVETLPTQTQDINPLPAVAAREEEVADTVMPIEAAMERFESSKLTKRTPKQIGRPKRLGGIRRINLVLSSDLHDYAMSAWRTYRKTSGEFVNGPSGFIEDLIRQHMQSAHHDS